MEFEASLLIDCGCELGEGVQWNAEEGRLYWTDIHGRALWSCDAEGCEIRRVPIEKGLCSFAFDPDGNILGAFKDGVGLLDPETGERQLMFAYQPDKPETRMNDGNVDRQGRFVVGGIDEGAEEPITPVWRIDEHGPEIILEHVRIANSIAFSPGGEVMYFADSPMRVIWAYDYDTVSGHPGARSELVRYGEEDGVPDGSTVDAEGLVWNAVWGAGEVRAIDADGNIVHRVRLAAPHATSCAFGGEGLSRLFITSARAGLDAQAVRRYPASGGVFAVDLPFRGLPHGRLSFRVGDIRHPVP